MNKPEERAADRAHPLCVFLGGDETALRVSRALRKDPFTGTVETLQDEWARPFHGWIPSVRGIGPLAEQRIAEKIKESEEQWAS